MYNIYVFEGGVIKYSKDRYTTYPPREYQLKLMKISREENQSSSHRERIVECSQVLQLFLDRSQALAGSGAALRGLPGV
jgi:hypothetical protein